MDAFISVRDLHYRYGNAGESIEALRGVSLNIVRGEYLAIVGPNGSGKSTLAKCLSGLLSPSSGDVRVNGASTRDAAALVGIRATVGMVLQNPDNQFVTSSVEDEVAFGPENLGVPPAEIRRRVASAIERVGMCGQELRDPHLLSSGEKARLAVAAMLAMEPQCLVLDEATATLDPRSRGSLLALLRELYSAGMTIITVTHHMTEVTRAKRVVVMERGQIALTGAPAEVFARDDALKGYGLALPPAAAVERGLARRGLELGRDVVTAEELVRRVVALWEGEG